MTISSIEGDIYKLEASSKVPKLSVVLIDKCFKFGGKINNGSSIYSESRNPFPIYSKLSNSERKFSSNKSSGNKQELIVKCFKRGNFINPLKCIIS